MKKPDAADLIKYEKLLQNAVKETGINLNLTRPFVLTPKDLVSVQQERRWAASRLLSRYSQEQNLHHSPQAGAVIKLDIQNQLLTVTALVSHQ